MNKKAIKGVVGNLTTRVFESGKTKISFSLKQEKGKGFLDCESWNTEIITNLKENMNIELTSYDLNKRSWVGKDGMKKYNLYVVVQEVIQLEPVGTYGDKSGFTPYNAEIEQSPSEGGLIEKYFPKAEETKEEEKDTVDLDWLNEME